MNMNKILNNILIVGIFATLLIPFVYAADIFSPMMDLYFPFITSKAYVFRVLVEVLFFLCLILALFDPNFRPKKSWILWSFISFLIVILIANLQGTDFKVSFWSNYERMEGYITLLHLFAYFLITTSVFYKTKLWNIFWNTSIALTIVHSGWALLQKFGVLDVGLSADRIDGTFGNAIYLGLFMLLHVFITLFYLLKHKGANWVKYLYVLAIILQIVTIFLTATRGAILALVGGVLLTFILISILEPKRKIIRIATAGIILATILFTVFIFGFKDTSAVKNVTAFRRLSEISFDSGTVMARFINWEIAWKGIKERPFLGYGQGNYGPVFDKYYDPKMWNQEQWFDRVHNIILDWTIAGGIIGLLAYLSIFVALLYYIWKKEEFDNIEKSVLTSLLVAYLFHNLFVFDNLTSYMVFILLIAFVHSRISNQQSAVSIQKAINIPKNIAIPISILFLIAIPFTVLAINSDGYNQNRQMIEGLRVKSLDDVVRSYDYFEKSLSYNSFGNTEVRHQLLQHSGRIIREKNVPLEIKQKFADLTAKEIQKEIETNPRNARFLILSGQFVAQTGNFDIALDLFNRARELSPKKQFFGEPMVEILFQLKRPTEALSLSKESYEINVENDNAWLNYVKTLYRVKDLESYESLLNEAFESGKGYRVINLVEENLRRDPDNIQALASLAVAYYRNEQEDIAIIQLEELAKRFPEAKDQAYSLIEKIKAGESIL